MRHSVDEGLETSVCLHTDATYISIDKNKIEKTIDEGRVSIKSHSK